jgi:hypothetical protein
VTLNTGEIISLVLLVVALILIAIYVMYRLRRRREAFLQEKEDPSWMEDIAYNQIRITRNLVERRENEGVDVARAREILKEAEDRQKSGDFEHAQALAKSARAELSNPTTPRVVRQRVPIREAKSDDNANVPYRDLSARVGDKKDASASVVPLSEEKSDKVAPEQPSDEVAPIQEYRKNVPKNYLEARFELQMLESDIKGRDPKQVSDEITRIFGDAKRAFDREDYTECLRLALRGRRLLGSANMQTISVSPGTTMETPQEPLPVARRSSGPPPEADVKVEATTGEVKPTSVACRRCGKENPAENRFCRGCGLPLAGPKCPRCLKEVAPEDTYCGSCGSPLNATV